jgi:putative ABC transport system permease protein
MPPAGNTSGSALEGARANVTMAKLAWRNVVRNWRHSLATTLAIASGFMAVCLFDGFIEELKDRNTDGYTTRGMLGQVIVQKRDASKFSSEDQWKYSVDAKEQAFLEAFFAKDPAFLRRVRFLSISGLVSAGSNNPVFIGYGFDVAEGAAVRGERWAWNSVAGKPLHLVKGPAIELGQSLAHLLDCTSTYTGKPFILEDGNYVAEERPFTCKHPRVMLSATTEASQVNAIELPIVGFIDAGFREADKRAVHISLADAQRLLDTDKLSMVSVQLKDPRETDAFVERINKAAAAAQIDLEITPWDEHALAAYVQGGMEILTVFRNLFMTIVVTIGVMSVANTMMKAVNERIREIGTLRSLGFRRRHLVAMFSCEGLFLSAIACVLGLVGTLFASRVVGHLGLTYRAGILSVPITLKVKDAPESWLVSAVVLTVLATGTAWFCARKAARMVVADAMRHV